MFQVPLDGKCHLEDAEMMQRKIIYRTLNVAKLQSPLGIFGKDCKDCRNLFHVWPRPSLEICVHVFEFFQPLSSLRSVDAASAKREVQEAPSGSQFFAMVKRLSRCRWSWHHFFSAIWHTWFLLGSTSSRRTFPIPRYNDLCRSDWFDLYIRL